MPTVSLVGSTGSIGTQAIEVIQSDPDQYEVVALAARSSIELLAEQAKKLRPRIVAIAETERADQLKALVPTGTEVRAGNDALSSVAREADVVLNAVVGFAGLGVTVAALEAGKRLALANKESLVAGGPVVQKARLTRGSEILPVDSEHCALHQCLSGERLDQVRRLILTASGGPFRTYSYPELEQVSIDDALAHPTWQMGPKITVDSSTLMNKGLEVIEAHQLFLLPYEKIEVVVHPQSIVHSAVEFLDGATVAQLSVPDMRLPIGYALGYPQRHRVAFGALDWSKAPELSFEPVDKERFPALDLAYSAGRTGDDAPAWLNAANEVAVEAFLAGRVPWLAISRIVRETLEVHQSSPLSSIEDVFEADHQARRRARELVEAGKYTL